MIQNLYLIGDRIPNIVKFLGGRKMSLFLGKIHYWLFNKIRYAEDLEKRISNWALDQDKLPAGQWKKDIEDKFGKVTEDKLLEELIDTSNNHGWLQDKITRVEIRQAAWITNILSINTEFKEALKEIYHLDGKEKGSKALNEYTIMEPKDVYAVLNDFLLEGMPCDSIDKKVEGDNNIFQWISTRCIHSPNWSRVGGDIKNYYELREVWTQAFVSTLSEDYAFSVEYDGDKRINTITRKR